MNTRRAWIIEQLAALVRNGAIPKSDAWIQTILDWLAVHGLFIVAKKAEKSAISAVSMAQCTPTPHRPLRFLSSSFPCLPGRAPPPVAPVRWMPGCLSDGSASRHLCPLRVRRSFTVTDSARGRSRSLAALCSQPCVFGGIAGQLSRAAPGVLGRPHRTDNSHQRCVLFSFKATLVTDMRKQRTRSHPRLLLSHLMGDSGCRGCCLPSKRSRRTPSMSSPFPNRTRRK